MTLTVGSTFSGVGGADLGLERAGFRVAWQCELDAWKRSILAAHWPNIPIHDDITTLHDPEPIDLLIGGFPCQDLSVAGKRKGFTGERSVLAFEFLRIAESIRPRWLLLENVPGLFSSSGGRDFARLIDEMVDIGYGVGWRILDARYFGVPQRRRRAFIVARRADAEFDSGAASRLALRALCESGSGDPTPSWPPREITTASVGSGIEDRGIFNATASFGGWREDVTAGTLSQRDYKSSNHLLAETIAFRKSKRAKSNTDDETWVEANETNTLNTFDVGDTRTTQVIAETFSVYPEGGNGADLAAAPVSISPALTQVKSERGVHVTHPIPFNAEFSNQASPGGDHMHTLNTKPSAAVAQNMTVRRLSPLECERLMGLPDGWTAPDGVKAPDSKRYAACGDAIVSWVAYWIGQRIKMIEEES